MKHFAGSSSRKEFSGEKLPEGSFHRFAGGRLILTAVLLISLLLSTGRVVSAQVKYDFSGTVKLFLSFYASNNQEGPYFYHRAGDFAFKRLEGRFRLKAAVSDNVSAEVRLDAFSRPDALFSSHTFPEAGLLGSPANSEPFELSLYEAFIRVNHFLIDNLDLTVGKQRIHWGTADKLSVVDNLNPVDFANFLTFDPDYYLERRPQVAFNLEYYPFSNSKFQLVWLPERQHSPLPDGFSEMLRVNLGALPQPEINVETEQPKLKNSSFGMRFSTVVFNVDVGVSYYRGNYSLPYIYGVQISHPLQPPALRVYFRYPGKQVFGLDLSGEIKSIGFWAELARTRPDRKPAWLESFMIIGPQILPLNVEFPLMDSYYWQWVVGADYTFSVADGLYLNAQYLHGLFDEVAFSPLARTYFNLRQGMWFGQLQDYLAGRAELKLLRGDLKIAVNSMVSLNSTENTKSSAIFYPSVEYRIHDAFYFQAGGIIATGDRQLSKFGGFNRDRLVYILTRMSF